MLLQCSYSCKFPASSIFSGWPWRYPVGQEPLPLKVAPIQSSVTAAFHLQSRRDSDCQMWELGRPTVLKCHWNDQLLRKASRLNGNNVANLPGWLTLANEFIQPFSERRKANIGVAAVSKSLPFSHLVVPVSAIRLCDKGWDFIFVRRYICEYKRLHHLTYRWSVA